MRIMMVGELGFHACMHELTFLCNMQASSGPIKASKRVLELKKAVHYVANDNK